MPGFTLFSPFTKARAWDVQLTTTKAQRLYFGALYWKLEIVHIVQSDKCTNCPRAILLVACKTI